MSNNILYLDDDKYEMLGYSERLEFDGFSVKYCLTPDEAYNLLKSGYKPDLIVSDLIMRQSSQETANESHYAGVNFSKVVREDLKINCPIIILTVVTEQSVLETVKKHDVIILSKPIPPKQLSSRVKEEIQKHKNK